MKNFYFIIKLSLLKLLLCLLFTLVVYLCTSAQNNIILVNKCSKTNVQFTLGHPTEKGGEPNKEIIFYLKPGQSKKLTLPLNSKYYFESFPLDHLGKEYKGKSKMIDSPHDETGEDSWWENGGSQKRLYIEPVPRRLYKIENITCPNPDVYQASRVYKPY